MFKVYWCLERLRWHQQALYNPLKEWKKPQDFSSRLYSGTDSLCGLGQRILPICLSFLSEMRLKILNYLLHRDAVKMINQINILHCFVQ